MKKIPFGTLAGISFFLLFYCSIAFFAAYLIFQGVASQTSSTVTPFDSWWQITLFIVACISLVAFIVFLILNIIKKKKYPNLMKKDEVEIQQMVDEGPSMFLNEKKASVIVEPIQEDQSIVFTKQHPFDAMFRR